MNHIFIEVKDTVLDIYIPYSLRVEKIIQKTIKDNFYKYDCRESNYTDHVLNQTHIYKLVFNIFNKINTQKFLVNLLEVLVEWDIPFEVKNNIDDD